MRFWNRLWVRSRSLGAPTEVTAAQEEQDPEHLHPHENPILQGYLLPGVHGTLKRYVLELFLVAGMLLPWIGPLLGLAVLVPIILLTVQNGKVITTDVDCFGGGIGPTLCTAQSYFDYYFWNITNPDEFLSGLQPPALQELGPYVFLVQETRWNVTFSTDFTQVNYSSLNFQTYVQDQSCATCSLTGDYLITINRGYLAFLASPLVNYNDALAFIPYVPSAMREIVAGIVAALEAAGVPAAAATSAAIQQWGRAAYGYPAQLAGSEDPTNPEFANWLHVYQGFTYSAASAVLSDSQAGTLLTLFQGNPALDSAAGYDGATNVELFAFYPAATVVATLNVYYPSLGLGTLQVELVQGYLYWVCQTFIVPTALYGGPAGKLLGPSAGGLLVKRPVSDWINGWRDPLVQQNVSMAFAWPANDTASALFGVPTIHLTHELSPLIVEYSLDTGKAKGGQAYNAQAYDQHTDVVAYPDTPLPYGAIPVTGSSGGLSFPINVHPDKRFTMFDTTFNRPLNISYTGQNIVNQGVSAWTFSLVDEQVQGCNISDPQATPQRCVYPDLFSHTFNATLTYSCPTLLSYPHYYLADPVLANSTGFDFAPDPAEHAWTFTIEPVSGYTTTGHKGYQINHLVKPTTFLYPSLWMNASAGVGGMWLPTFWARSRFQPSPSSAASLLAGLNLRSAFIAYPTYVTPPIFIFLLAIGVLFLGLTPGAKRVRQESEALQTSKARPFELTEAEAESVAHLPDAADERKDKRPTIFMLEERYGDFWDSSEYSDGASTTPDRQFTPREYSPG